MKRPIRNHLNVDNLLLMGVAKKYVHKTIEDFKDFDTLQRVKATIKKYLQNIDQQFENNLGLFLCGSNGVGKTFLASIIIVEAYRHRYTAKRTTFAEYMTRYTAMWGAKSAEERETLEEDFYNRYKGVEFLVLEEIGKEIDSKVATPILEDLLRYREDKGLVTIICTNLAPAEVKERYGESCYSLIRGNTTPIQIEGEDRRLEFYQDRGE